MANKVFRIHQDGSAQNGWFTSSHISQNTINSIEDGLSASSAVPTSIPSPFARVDLVKTAFREVSKQDVDGNYINLTGNTPYHKLVSDALDIGQMFFNANSDSRLTISFWDKEQELKNLIESPSENHKQVGETLGLFLAQDAASYNFDKADGFFFLKFNNTVIGGTSPSTLFFAAADTKIKELNIQYGSDIMLDNAYRELHQRTSDFVEYLFAIKASVPNFAALFPEFNSYLLATLSEIRKSDNDFANRLNLLDSSSLSTYEDLAVTNQPGMFISPIRGFKLKIAPEKAVTSDFELITPNVFNSTPLALPSTGFNQPWNYVDSNWNANTEVPFFNSQRLEERTLPASSRKYPYITLNDVLSPSLVRLPYSIDSSVYHTFDKDGKYLAPLEPLFFQLFPASELGRTVELEIEEGAIDGVVNVKLTLPVRGGKIKYSKVYTLPSSTADFADSTSKDGSIIELALDVAISPLVKSDLIDIHRTVGMIFSGDSRTTPRISLFNSSSSNSIGGDFKVRIEGDSDVYSTSSTYANISEDFDCVHLSNDNLSAYFLPKFKRYVSGGNRASFSIDFGTTNSHVEFRIDNAQPKGLNWTYNDNVVSSASGYLYNSPTEFMSESFVRFTAAMDLFVKELLPYSLGTSSDASFPTRTALIERSDVNYNQKTELFKDANIGFAYEKLPVSGNEKVRTNLKWSHSGDEADGKRVEMFFEELLMLCKNLLLINNCSISDSNIVWTYPTAMSMHRLNMLRDNWEKAASKVFGSQGSPKLESAIESLAPFYYYSTNEDLNYLVKPVVSVDIGGGTSDLVVYERGIPKLVTSFKFAGNDIFGDGLNSNISKNGFFKKYKSKYEQLLLENDLTELVGVMNTVINQQNNSSDFVNFLFSLKDNRKVLEKSENIDFAKELIKDDSMRSVFLLYYSALFYHIAELFKVNGLDAPNNLLFSGTGSKSAFVLTGGNNPESQQLLGKLFSQIFLKVTGQDSNIQIRIDENPKEITAKGGLYKGDDSTEIDSVIQLSLGTGEINDIVTPRKNLTEQIKLTQVDDETLSKVIDNIEEFERTLSNVDQEISFKNTFGIDLNAIKGLNEVLQDKDSIKNALLIGLERQKTDMGSEDEIVQETFFFYPVVVMLNKLASKLAS